MLASGEEMVVVQGLLSPWPIYKRMAVQQVLFIVTWFARRYCSKSVVRA